MKVDSIENIDFYTLHKILTSNRITDSQKTTFLINNKAQIKELMKSNLTSSEFKSIIETRPLIKFRPLKNSYTKAGDKILLAKTLGLQPSEVNSYIKNVSEGLELVKDLDFLPKDKLDAIKTYIYRHGSKDQIVTFLDYELSVAKDKIKTIYNTLEYHTGGIADYFIRPIHRMDNKTFVRLYNIIDKHIKTSEKEGFISTADSEKVAKWSLIQLFKIRHNSKFVNAIKTYKVLSQN